MYSPLPSSKTLHFQNEAKCTAFLMKMSIICMRMKIIPISKAEQQSDNSQVLSIVENLASLCTAAPPFSPLPLPFPSSTSLQHTRDTLFIKLP